MRILHGIAAWTAAMVFGTGVALAQSTAPAPSAAPPPAAGPQATPAEIEFWNTVKDARNPAEFKAYLETYPNGAFAALAKVRIRALEEAASQKKSTDDQKAPADAKAAADAARAAAVAKAAAEVRAQTASALTDPNTIREVQAKLYNLNYTVGPQNGALTNETREAIRQWQSNLKKPVTGDMTLSDVALLRAASIPTTWGAIAYNARGGSSAVWLRGTRQDAEAATMEGCRKLNGGNCSVVTAVNNGCGAVSFASGVVGSTQHTGAYAVIRPTQAQAIDQALSDCRSRSRVPNNCGIRNTMCADGSHKK